VSKFDVGYYRSLLEKAWAEVVCVFMEKIELVQISLLLALRREGSVALNNFPRMADFCQWIVECEPALPWNPGEFMKAYLGQAEDALTNLVDSNKVALAIYRLVVDLVNETEEKDRCFKGSANELLEKLNVSEKIYHGNAPRIGLKMPVP
jgi:hypothetical protein